MGNEESDPSGASPAPSVQDGWLAGSPGAPLMDMFVDSVYDRLMYFWVLSLVRASWQGDNRSSLEQRISSCTSLSGPNLGQASSFQT